MSTTTKIGMLVGTTFLILMIGSLIFTPAIVYGITRRILLPPVIPIPPLSPPAPYPIKYAPPYPYQITAL